MHACARFPRRLEKRRILGCRRRHPLRGCSPELLYALCKTLTWRSKISHGHSNARLAEAETRVAIQGVDCNTSDRGCILVSSFRKSSQCNNKESIKACTAPTATLTRIISNQRSQTKDSKTKIPKQRSRTKDPKPKIQNQRSQTNDLKLTVLSNKFLS